ncbi:MAG: winged helix-turn-helix transcriptional regulator [Flavobacterium sp.]
MSKTVYKGYPLKVEYSLTDFGNTLLPLIEMMQLWGDEHGKKVAQLAKNRNENIEE